MSKRNTRDIHTLRDLRGSLDERGRLMLELTESPPPKSKRSLICSTIACDDLSPFCENAGDTISMNLIQVYKKSPSLFQKSSLSITVDIISKLASNPRLESAIALSLLVHASKFDSDKGLKRFMSLARAFSEDTYRMATEDEIPADILNEGISLLCDSVLKDSLLDGFLHMSAADIRGMKIYIVHLQDDLMNGWCVPGGIALNIRALQRKATLQDPVAFAVLAGHEIRHALERICAENNLNFSTPENPSQIPSPPEKNRESGLGFELRAIGEKYDYVQSPLVTELLEAIKAGIKSKLAPALNEEARVRFESLVKPHNKEMAFDCDDWIEGEVFEG